ncbi:hypothetical protein HGRIS_001344 [Hohenbuehelia grisea]|uniref:Uncharacterized protein n=1 Tax=Hohenbuehelia grisea TaxID=104357 RepID=A0ABR3JQF0_9AGAR
MCTSGAKAAALKITDPEPPSVSAEFSKAADPKALKESGLTRRSVPRAGALHISKTVLR